MNASECCEKLLQQVKGSNLHYTLSENAFSVEIKIKKRFIDQKPASDLLQKSSSLQNQVSRNPFPGKKVLRKNIQKNLNFRDVQNQNPLNLPVLSPGPLFPPPGFPSLHHDQLYLANPFTSKIQLPPHPSMTRSNLDTLNPSTITNSLMASVNNSTQTLKPSMTNSTSPHMNPSTTTNTTGHHSNFSNKKHSCAPLPMITANTLSSSMPNNLELSLNPSMTNSTMSMNTSLINRGSPTLKNYVNSSIGAALIQTDTSSFSARPSPTEPRSSSTLNISPVNNSGSSFQQFSPPRSSPGSSSPTPTISSGSWESFPFKLHPLEYSDDEDYVTKEESVFEFKKRLEENLRRSYKRKKL